MASLLSGEVYDKEMIIINAILMLLAGIQFATYKDDGGWKKKVVVFTITMGLLLAIGLEVTR